MKPKKIIRHTVEELIDKGNLDIIEASFAKNYVAHAGEKRYEGHDFIRKFIGQLRTSIPNIRVDDVQFLAVDDKTVVWQRTFSGTHKVAMQGIPASNKRVKWVEMVVTRFRKGRIAEEWLVSELMGQLMVKQPSRPAAKKSALV
jgi:steroid delta-isomerase-like uncharacterized protein